MRRLEITKINLTLPRLPARFQGFKIAQVSDLHNKDFKGELLKKLDMQKPDIIVITGDMIDRNEKISAALKFGETAVKIAPVYYVNGNHESVLKVYGKFKANLKEFGVNVLENERIVIERDGEEPSKINILGLSDPRFFKGGKTEYKEELYRQIQSLNGEFCVLITHRPEMFFDYAAAGADVIFVGHAHGGQIRIPFLGALYAPNQGIFPKFTNGVHIKENSQMVISRGMGSSNFVPRIFNNSELVIATLNCGHEN